MSLHTYIYMHINTLYIYIVYLYIYIQYIYIYTVYLYAIHTSRDNQRYSPELYLWSHATETSLYFFQKGSDDMHAKGYIDAQSTAVGRGFMHATPSQMSLECAHPGPYSTCLWTFENDKICKSLQNLLRSFTFDQ